jgi:hypothetical protein
MQIKFNQAIFKQAFKKISPNGILFIKSKFFLCAFWRKRGEVHFVTLGYLSLPIIRCT